jgi:Spy/CpxP family protein refolding chaperone
MRRIIFTLLIILVASAAFAQPRGPRSWHGEGDFDRPPKEMVEAFRLFKLTEELELTESQTVKIYPLLAQTNKERESQHEALQAKMKELRDLLDEEKVDDRKAAKLAMEIHNERMEVQARQHQMRSELLDLLDDEQKAKFIIFEHGFQSHLRGVKERMHERFDGERGNFDKERKRSKNGPPRRR